MPKMICEARPSEHCPEPLYVCVDFTLDLRRMLLNARYAYLRAAGTSELVLNEIAFDDGTGAFPTEFAEDEDEDALEARPGRWVEAAESTMTGAERAEVEPEGAIGTEDRELVVTRGGFRWRWRTTAGEVVWETEWVGWLELDEIVRPAAAPYTVAEANDGEGTRRWVVDGGNEGGGRYTFDTEAGAESWRTTLAESWDPQSPGACPRCGCGATRLGEWVRREWSPVELTANGDLEVVAGRDEIEPNCSLLPEELFCERCDADFPVPEGKTIVWK